MANTNNTTTLSLNDLSAQYAPGSFLATVTFIMFGITFVAKRFVRTDCPVNSYELYIAHDSSWCHDYIRAINPTSTEKVDARALHLLAVAETLCVKTDADERTALLELAA
jgi:hypothetical protein